MAIQKLTTASTLKEWRETINQIIDLLQVASPTSIGLMSLEDKKKLDTIDKTVTEQSSNLVSSGAVYEFVKSQLSK